MHEEIDRKEFIESFLIHRTLDHGFRELETITDKWGYIRQVYMDLMPEIRETASSDICRFADVYPLDWMLHFSEPEKLAWHSIRVRRMALYPQFPVFNYFIDFAHPTLRIGLEIDGKDYHDEEKDRIRDEKLLSIGWRIYRVPAREAYVEHIEDYRIREINLDEEGHEQDITFWIMNTLDGVVHALEMVYFREIPYQDKAEIDLYPWCIRTLEHHRLIPFPIEGSVFA